MIEQAWSDLIAFTSQFVVPDWGALIALLPVFLAVPVFVYITWTIYRWATAGPTRSGKRRPQPAPPPGVHMPGPTFAPVIAAGGLVMLAFGLVAGGIWLAVGAIALVVTLLYWGRESLREYDRIPAAAAGRPIAAGMIPAPAGTPPDGVHLPPPSFRPILVAIAMTILVAGLIVGGWLILVGFLAIVITGLGWLLDARREYAAVERADRSGHLDLGGAPRWPKATFAALAVLVAIGLAFSSGLLPNSGSGSGAAPSGGPAAGGGGGAPASQAPDLPPADVTITAANIDFVTKQVTAPPDKPFTIAFDNQDSVPHDIVIKDDSGGTVFQGEVVTGPKVVVYDVPALTAGGYTFVCSIHPNMTGSLSVG
jgi:plastocyanin